MQTRILTSGCKRVNFHGSWILATPRDHAGICGIAYCRNTHLERLQVVRLCEPISILWLRGGRRCCSSRSYLTTSEYFFIWRRAKNWLLSRRRQEFDWQMVHPITCQVFLLQRVSSEGFSRGSVLQSSRRAGSVNCWPVIMTQTLRSSFPL